MNPATSRALPCSVPAPPTPRESQPIWSRRQFLGTAAGAVGALSATGLLRGAESTRPALLGGTPIRQQPFPAWPVIEPADEQALLTVLRSGKWFRGYGNTVAQFEAAYAALMGAKHCVATANGTSALFASLGALDVSPGDEVILPPYTFVATLNVVLLQHALPVFVDTDPETFQMDARRLEAAITPLTTAVIPVHLGGGAVDLDQVLDVAKRRRLRVVEDACQSHLAEWRGRKVGSWGDTGCFSFQASKNLNCGEGGAILAQDDEVAERCYAFHNNGRARHTPAYQATHVGGRSANLRLTEFQAGLLLSQMTRLEAQSQVRERNAAYLTQMLKEIPGIQPARTYPGCTRNAYHLYMFRYDSAAFAGLSRDRFLRALEAEGVPCSGGYSPLNQAPFLLASLKTRAYRKLYPPQLLEQWAERNRCPANEQLCRQAVWLTQTMLLGPRGDMEQIAGAVRRIQDHAAALAKEA